tara:strand:+ start:1336 stop:2400 length:1065 start_codon:yes stop_codon:yes gene_type:complete
VNKVDAERRSRRIRAFRDELSELETEGILHLPAEDVSRVTAYHDDLLSRFSAAFDTNLNDGEAHLSWGMRLVSGLGAVALSLAVFLFFNHYWDAFSTPLQVTLATLAPFLGWAVTELVARLFRTSYFTELAALVTIACFVLNLHLLAEIYNITPSPGAFFSWGIFALLLAIRHGLDLVLGLGLASLAVFIGASLTGFIGLYWLQEFIAEFYFAGFALFLLAPVVLRVSWVRDNRLIFFLVGMLGLFLLLLSLAIGVPDSVLPFSTEMQKWIYLVVALVIGSGALALSVRAGWVVGACLAACFLILFLLFKYFDWFWDKWPAYIFFLILGLLAVLVILVLRKLRLMGRREAGNAG